MVLWVIGENKSFPIIEGYATNDFIVQLFSVKRV
jgi:hypothetical protein